MNKIQLTTVLLFCAALTPVSAQFNRGTFMAGGGMTYNHYANKIDFNNTTTTVSTSNVFFFQPQAGYFILNHLAVGMGIGYTRGVTKAKSDGAKETDISKSIAPFARYYYHHVFGQFTYQIGSGTTKYVGYDATDQSYKLHGWRLAFGYAWLLNEHVAIEPQVGYAVQNENFNGDKSDTNINGGVFVQVGIQIYLHQK